MGLIKAALGSAGGVLADQWKEFFTCDALPVGVLMAKGVKKTDKRSSNTKGSDNVISNGSVIAVADGQCMCIVEQGKIVDMCAEPGEYTYDMSTEPSLFTGNLGENIKAVFENVGKRFTFGGMAPKDQRVYYFNTREMVGMKFGTPTPVPFRVVDERAGIDIDVSVRCFGTYSFRLANPMLFYANVSGNVSDEFKLQGSELEEQMRSEFLTHLQPAFARISAMGIRYSSVLAHTKELADAMRDELAIEWGETRGIEIVKVGVNSISATEEDEKMMKELQRNAAFMDPARANAFITGSVGSAMQSAANNPGGAAVGFMGMNMAAGMAGNLYQPVPQQPAAPAAPAAPAPAPAAPAAPAGWTCACGQAGNTGKFCMNCGKPEPAPADSWTCSCGTVNTGKFCMNCGSPKPAADDGWTCTCGTVNKGKFCMNCGSPKPAGAPQYKCDKCGWEPEKGAPLPKFCPQCGDPFDNGDLQ